MKLKSLAVIVLAALAALVAPARAVECDQLVGTPSGMGLCVPRLGTDGDQWGQAIIDAFTTINSSATIEGSTDAYNAMGWVAANRISGMPTGPSGIQISSYTWFASSAAVTGGGGLAVTYGVSAASMTTTGGATIGTFLNLGGVYTNAYPLDVRRDFAGDHIAFFNNSSATGWGPLIKAGPAGNNAYSSLRVQDKDGGALMYVQAGGSVGIGTPTPATTLDVNGNARFGSGATKSTFTATGNLALAAGAGLVAGTSLSTMTPTGLLFFASSATISGSTFTATGTTYFSTYTLLANALPNVGESVTVECAFQNSDASATGAFQAVWWTAGNEMGYTQVTTASQIVKVKSVLTRISASAALNMPEARSIAPAGVGQDVSVNPNGTMIPLAFDPTAGQTFKCEGRASSGGTVGFLWMKVRKGE